MDLKEYLNFVGISIKALPLGFAVTNQHMTTIVYSNVQTPRSYVWKQWCKGEKHLKPLQVWTEVTGQPVTVMSQIANAHQHQQQSRNTETENSRWCVSVIHPSVGWCYVTKMSLVWDWPRILKRSFCLFSYNCLQSHSSLPKCAHVKCF